MTSGVAADGIPHVGMEKEIEYSYIMEVLNGIKEIAI